MELLLEAGGDARIRLSSTEPDESVNGLIDLMAREPRVCRFLHLPVQHGSDSILKDMGRSCFTGLYAELANRARELMPEIHIGTDVIVAFPGETEALFNESYEFLKSLKFANMHIFPFSPREGTPAASMMGQVPEQDVKRRVKLLSDLKLKMSESFARKNVGRVLEILALKNGGTGVARGVSGNYLLVDILGDVLI